MKFTCPIWFQARKISPRSHKTLLPFHFAINVIHTASTLWTCSCKRRLWPAYRPANQSQTYSGLLQIRRSRAIDETKVGVFNRFFACCTFCFLYADHEIVSRDFPFNLLLILCKGLSSKKKNLLCCVDGGVKHEICYQICWKESNYHRKKITKQGPVFRKSLKRSGPEKPFVKLWPPYSVNLVFSYVVKGIEIKITVKFRASRRLRFEDTKRIKSPEITPEKFRDFREKSETARGWNETSKRLFPQVKLSGLHSENKNEQACFMWIVW